MSLPTRGKHECSSSSGASITTRSGRTAHLDIDRLQLKSSYLERNYP